MVIISIAQKRRRRWKKLTLVAFNHVVDLFANPRTYSNNSFGEMANKQLTTHPSISVFSGCESSSVFLQKEGTKNGHCGRRWLLACYYHGSTSQLLERENFNERVNSYLKSFVGFLLLIFYCVILLFFTGEWTSMDSFLFLLCSFSATFKSLLQSFLGNLNFPVLDFLNCCFFAMLFFCFNGWMFFGELN